MKTSSHSVAPQIPDSPALDAPAIRAQLEKILASAPMRNSKRCQSLLKYTVEAALEGTPERVKERSIGVEVFGREPEYDTNQDSVVRNAAIEVRKRLAQYYLEPGHQTEIRIEIPQGGYLPEFRPPAVGAATAEPDAVARRRPRSALWLLTATALLVCVAAAAWLWQGTAHLTEFDRFWAPILNAQGSVLVCVGQPMRLYNIVGPRQAELNGKLGTLGSPRQQDDVLARTPLMLSELNTVGGRYLFFGDSVCMMKIASVLQSRGKEFQVRGEASTPFQDLRGNPVLLIGLFNNRWTQRLTGNLRYYFVRIPEKQRDELHDRLNPAKEPWIVAGEGLRSEDGFDDYAVVTRALDPSTERPLIAVAGVTQWGTQSAGEFVAHPEYLREAFRNAPRDWYRKNLQVVLRTHAVGGAAGPPQVVAIHYY